MSELLETIKSNALALLTAGGALAVGLGWVGNTTDGLVVAFGGVLIGGVIAIVNVIDRKTASTERVALLAHGAAKTETPRGRTKVGA